MSVNTIGLDDPNARPDAELDFAAAQGFSAVRIPVRWSSVEPVEGKLDFSALDPVIRGAAARGLEVLGVVTWAPAWAVAPEYRTVTHPAPESAARFAEFARVAAFRYRSQVSAWEVWNEPNIAASFGPIPDVSKYCAILRQSYTAIKAANPSATVLTGGTSPTRDSPTGVAPANYINALYKCAPRSFDALAMHPYSTPNLLSRPSSTNPSSRDVALVREVMKLNGDTRRKVWFTEFGAPTTQFSPTGVSEEKQKQILVDGVSLLKQLSYAGPVFVFNLRDIETGSRIPDYNYGLARTDFTLKPSLKAVIGLYN
ncbi:hypothetical protein GCM10009619_27400 [Williamsia maris]